MNKPGSIASNLKLMVEGIERKCDGKHKHAIARGRECKLAERYTAPFARRVHVLLRMTADGPDMFQKEYDLVEHDYAPAEAAEACAASTTRYRGGHSITRQFLPSFGAEQW